MGKYQEYQVIMNDGTMMKIVSLNMFNALKQIDNLIKSKVPISITWIGISKD